MEKGGNVTREGGGRKGKGDQTCGMNGTTRNDDSNGKRLFPPSFLSRHKDRMVFSHLRIYPTPISFAPLDEDRSSPDSSFLTGSSHTEKGEVLICLLFFDRRV